MDMFVIRGGRPLAGTVSVSGAKNAALPIMAAALAVDGRCTLRNVPDLADIRTQCALLTQLGMRAERQDSALCIERVTDQPCVADYDLVRRMRAGVYVRGFFSRSRSIATSRAD